MSAAAFAAPSAKHARQAATWGLSGFDYQNDFFNRFDKQITPRNAKAWKQVWSYAAPAAQNACGPGTNHQVVVGGGKAYYSSNGYLLAVNVRTGKLAWKQTEAKTPDSDYVPQNPVLYNGKIYSVFVNCNSESIPGYSLYSFDAATGKPGRVYPAGANQPVFAFGNIYVRVDPDEGSGGYSGLAAFNATTGRRLWKVPNSDDIPAFANRNVLYTQSGARNPKTGAVLWSAPPDVGLRSADVNSGMVYGQLNTFVNNVYSTSTVGLNGATGDILWSAPGDGASSWPVYFYIGVGTLYGQLNGMVHAIDGKTGNAIPYKTPYGCDFAPEAIVNGVVIGVTQGCGTVAVNAKTGGYLATLSRTSRTAPVVAGSLVFITVGKSLVALKPVGK
jgi:outer membrane protein assembly factor BamB